MKATYQILLDNSLSAAISAIEIYNKPDFKYRNETFVILIINAWELLLKAKILKDNHNNKISLYVKGSDNEYITSRTGNYLTIEITKAMSAVKLNSTLKENIEHILEIRDTAIHFYNKDTISYTIFALGAATLQNYQKIIKQWFSRDLTAYNFYILPLGFNYSFKNFSMIDINAEPEAIRNLLKVIVKSQNSGFDFQSGFYLVADIIAEVTSAKKMANPADITIAIDQKSSDSGIIRQQKIIDLYPFTTAEVWEQVKLAIPSLKQNTFYEFIKLNKMKQNKKYSAYNFTSKKQEANFLSKKIKYFPISLYNQDAIQFIITNI